MPINREARNKAIRGSRLHFVCIKMRNHQGATLECVREDIKQVLGSMEGMYRVSVGDRDVGLYVMGVEVTDKYVMGIKQELVRVTGRKMDKWAVGYYVQTLGVLDVEAYKSYIAGL